MQIPGAGSRFLGPGPKGFHVFLLNFVRFGSVWHLLVQVPLNGAVRDTDLSIEGFTQIENCHLDSKPSPSPCTRHTRQKFFKSEQIWDVHPNSDKVPKLRAKFHNLVELPEKQFRLGADPTHPNLNILDLN